MFGNSGVNLLPKSPRKRGDIRSRDEILEESGINSRVDALGGVFDRTRSGKRLGNEGSPASTAEITKGGSDVGANTECRFLEAPSSFPRRRAAPDTTVNPNEP